jgi:hypothetical protein
MLVITSAFSVKYHSCAKFFGIVDSMAGKMNLIIKHIMNFVGLLKFQPTIE